MLIGAGLLINSLFRLHQEDVGVHAEGVVTVATPVAKEQRQTPAAFLAFTEQMLGIIGHNKDGDVGGRGGQVSDPAGFGRGSEIPDGAHRPDAEAAGEAEEGPG